jgi:hypothetical protein
VNLPQATPGVNCAAVVEHKEAVHPRRCVPIERIIHVVAEYVGVRVKDVVGDTRGRKVATARQMITVLARELTPMSFPEISAAMGRTSHSTIIEAYQRWQLREQNADYDVGEFVWTTTGHLKPQNALREARERVQKTVPQRGEPTDWAST